MKSALANAYNLRVQLKHHGIPLDRLIWLPKTAEYATQIGNRRQGVPKHVIYQAQEKFYEQFEHKVKDEVMLLKKGTIEPKQWMTRTCALLINHEALQDLICNGGLDEEYLDHACSYLFSPMGGEFDIKWNYSQKIYMKSLKELDEKRANKKYGQNYEYGCFECDCMKLVRTAEIFVSPRYWDIANGGEALRDQIFGKVAFRR